MGIPHTEIDLILVNGDPVGFEYRPAVGDRIAVYPMFEALDIGVTARLRPEPLRQPRFVIDVNLGRLARLLRLLGFDVWWSNDADDQALADISVEQRRILLTRDRGLLKRRAITPRPVRPLPAARGADAGDAAAAGPAAAGQAVHPVRAVQRAAGRGDEGGGDGPSGAVDPALLQRIQSLSGLWTDLLAWSAFRQTAQSGRRIDRPTLTGLCGRRRTLGPFPLSLYGRGWGLRQGP